MLRKFKSWFDHEPPSELLFEPQTLVHNGQQYYLRKMVNTDIDAALVIEQQIYHDTPWDRVAFLSELRKVQHSLYLVLIEGQTMVAFIGCWFTKAEAHVTNIAVAPVFQHQGLGKLLMNVMIARAYEFGSEKMTLEVRTNNSIAQGLYHDLGFTDGRIKKGYYVANHDDAMDMVRQLD